MQKNCCMEPLEDMDPILGRAHHKITKKISHVNSKYGPTIKNRLSERMQEGHQRTLQGRKFGPMNQMQDMQDWLDCYVAEDSSILSVGPSQGSRFQISHPA